MNSLFMDRPLLKTGVFGILLMPFIILMNDFSPPKDKIPDGYGSSILAFEFASDEKELVEVLGDLNSREKADMDRLNYVDFGFMILYGIFLFLFMARFGQLTNDKLLDKAKWLAPVIVICDALENMQLLKLNNLFADANAKLEGTLTMLALFTWLKWLLLACAFAFVARRLIQMKLWSTIAGYVLWIPLALGVMAFVSGLRWSEDIFASSVFIGFLIIFIYSFLYQKNYIPPTSSGE